MSATTIERPSVQMAQATAAGGGRAPADLMAAWTDFDRKHYTDTMIMIRQRMLDMVKGVRDGEMQAEHDRGKLTFQFAKTGFGSLMNGFKAFTNPMQLATWIFNIAESALELKTSLKHYARSQENFQRTQEGLLFTIRTGLDLRKREAPLDSRGQPIVMDDPLMFLPQPTSFKARDRAFIDKYIPEFMPERLLGNVTDRANPPRLHDAYRPAPPAQR